MRQDDRSEWWLRGLLALTVVVGALTLVATSMIFGLDRSSSPTEERAGRASREAIAPGPEPVEGAGPTPTGDPETDAVLTEIARFVELERGLAFQRPVTVETLDYQAFEARLFAAVEKDAEQLRIEAQALQALGFATSVNEVESGRRTLLAVGVLGFYDAETDELVVRGDDLSPLSRHTIAHELTHALDDQWFDLDKPEYEDSDDEIAFGVSALAEGNARRVDGAYRGSLSSADRQQIREQTEALPRPTQPIPPVLIELITAPYELGEPLVVELLRRGEQAELDAAFRAPPRTSEQVIDPEKLFAREGALAVATPPAEGTVLDEGTFGQFMLQLVLERGLGRGRVNRATAGWGGDRYVLWQQGGEYCLRVDIAADTPADLVELDDALQDVIRGDLPSARVEQPQPDRLRFTSCN